MSSSFGMKLSLPPEMAAKLRKTTQTEKGPEANESVQQNSESTGTKKDTKLPEISIDVENLVGYKPELEEMESIKSQLLDAMWTRYRLEERDDAPNDSSPQTTVPPDFDFQVVELLQSGVARFKQSSDEDDSSTNETSLMILSYPPTIITSGGESKSTSKLWRRTSNCPSAFRSNDATEFIPRLWNYLAHCSRNLDWKYQMSQELENLVEQEEARIRYEEWTTTQRKAKLDQLYSIRETIVHQVDMSKVKYDAFVQERENIVKEKLNQQKRIEASKTADLSFPEEFALLGMRDRATDEPEDDWELGDDDAYSIDDGSDYSDYSDGSEGGYGSGDSLSEIEEEKGDHGPIYISQQQELQRGDGATHSTEAQHSQIEGEQNDEFPQPPTDGTAVVEGTAAAETHGLSLPFVRREERRRRAKERKRQERKEAKSQAEKERLKALEQEIREKYTSQDMVVAQTIYESLTKKLETVEELLESLQDEEWQAEEDRENEAESKKDTIHESDKSFTLLDQILAMILGMTPVPRGKTPEEHYRLVQEEHKTIVKEWKSYFGRLPTSLGGASGWTESASPPPDFTESASPSQLRMQLGIADNSDDDWDVDDDIEQKAKANPAKPSKVFGLRPGGSLK